jgi:hypothetical protein
MTNTAATATATSVTAMDDQRPWKLVTHERPDTDAYLCLWAAARFVVKTNDFIAAFVRAGEQLTPEDMEGFRVLHMDTGLGDLDQHGKQLGRTSSFELFCKAHGLMEDGALEPLIELSRATDNVEEVSPTDIHYVFKGLAYHYTDPATKETDWSGATTFAFTILDILYGQAKNNRNAVEDFKRLGKMITLDNGLKVASIFHQPRLRNAAYQAGADVVVWTEDQKGAFKGKFQVGIQTNRNSSVTIRSVISGIRIAEATRRGLGYEQTKDHDFTAIGKDDLFGSWYLHDSEKLIVCGSRAHPLESDQEFTRLNPNEILKIVCERLGKHRPQKK